MTDIVNPAKRSEMMAGIGSKNTKPELAVRKILHTAGFRYRLHRRDLPGKPAVVLPKFKTVIFVNGCYWHGHGDCDLFRPPKTRTDFWMGKISGNKERDRRKADELIKLGWNVIVVWECAIKGKGRLEPNALSEILAEKLNVGDDYQEVIGFT